MALVKETTVEEEMKKNPKLTKSDLQMLQDWLKKQPHLPPMSDCELMLFLHSNYYRTEPTKLTIDSFFTFRTHVPEFFTKRDPLSSKELREIMKVVCCISLPKTTPEGYKVVFSKLMDSDPSHYVFTDAIKLAFMVMELWLYIAGTNPGQIIVLDMEGTALGHLARLSPMVMKKFLTYLQDAIPVRLKSIHYINTVPFMDMFLNLAKPFMKKELVDMLYFHPTVTTLNNHFPIDLLPNEQGGKAGPVNDLWKAQIKEIEEHSGWFQNEETRKVTLMALVGVSFADVSHILQHNTGTATTTIPPPPIPYNFQYSAGRYPGHVDRVHHESGDGSGTVHGTYSYVDPKQKVRTVEYTADKNGFHPLLTNFEDTQAVPVDSEAVSLAKQKHYALYERIANAHAQGVAANAPAESASVARAKQQHSQLFAKIANQHAAIAAEREEERRIRGEPIEEQI